MTKRATNKTTHTKGPWTARIDARGGWSVEVGVGTNWNKVVCARVPWPHRADESRANARLIAEAPSLLVALDAVMREYRTCTCREGEVWGGQWCVVWCAWCLAQLALAQAGAPGWPRAELRRRLARLRTGTWALSGTSKIASRRRGKS